MSALQPAKAKDISASTATCGTRRERSNSTIPCLHRGPTPAPDAADPKDATLHSKRIAHKAIWVEPELLAEIEYRARSAEGKVRHPFFRGVREGSMMDAFDLYWQWANKHPESRH